MIDLSFLITLFEIIKCDLLFRYIDDFDNLVT